MEALSYMEGAFILNPIVVEVQTIDGALLVGQQ